VQPVLTVVPPDPRAGGSPGVRRLVRKGHVGPPRPRHEGRAAVTRRQVMLVFAGVMLAMLLAALDQTIVATALPTIALDLHGIQHYAWVADAYLVTSTVTVPIYGKLSDMFGRRSLFLVSISIFLAGSVLCGLSQSM